MISVVITAKNEEGTIGRAVRAFLKQDYWQENNLQINKDYEILVVAPDEATLKAAGEGGNQVRAMKDSNSGKPAALNTAIKEAKGEKVIFSDGDTEVGKSAVKELLKGQGEIIGGRPVAFGDKIGNRYDFWQEVLFETANFLRKKAAGENGFMPVSGYLFLAERAVFDDFKWPENILTEDEYLSYYVFNKGLKIGYAPEAKVKVVFPQNYQDWLKQKIRTLGGSYQIPKEWKRKVAGRSFCQEVGGALRMIKKYDKSLKQIYWLKLLFFARLHGWLLAWWKVKFLKQNREAVWQRVGSTKGR